LPTASPAGPPPSPGLVFSPRLLSAFRFIALLYKALEEEQLSERITHPGFSDPHHFNADPDPALHFNEDPDPAFHFNADKDPSLHFTSDPDPAFHLNADPDPAFHFNADTDPAFHFHADTDPVFHLNADPNIQVSFDVARNQNQPKLFSVIF
jgi:hypothetical protein